MLYQKLIKLFSRKLKKLLNQTTQLMLFISIINIMFPLEIKQFIQLYLMELSTFQFTLPQLTKLIYWNQSLQLNLERLIQLELDPLHTFQQVLFQKLSKKYSLQQKNKFHLRIQLLKSMVPTIFQLKINLLSQLRLRIAHTFQYSK